MKIIALIVFALILIGIPTGFAQEQVKREQKKSEHGFAVKELKTFHDLLHPLVHDALPKGDFERIRGDLDKLLKKATSIQKVKLPKELLGRRKEFQAKSKELVVQLTDMVAMKEKVDDATLEKKFDEMHETFEQLAEIAK